MVHMAVLDRAGHDVACVDDEYAHGEDLGLAGRP
jgi:hypothetical protein